MVAATGDRTFGDTSRKPFPAADEGASPHHHETLASLAAHHAIGMNPNPGSSDPVRF
jgi:hypothetical protein